MKFSILHFIKLKNWSVNEKVQSNSEISHVGNSAQTMCLNIFWQILMQTCCIKFRQTSFGRNAKFYDDRSSETNSLYI